MALIENTDSSTLPYNDDYMVYDLDEQMYVLTEKGVKFYTGYDILSMSKSQEKSDANRYRISRDVYNYIRRNSKINSYKQKVFWIAKDSNIRKDFKRALVEQALYYIESGAGSIKTQHGVNIANGKVIDINELRGRVLISVGAETILAQTGLLFRGFLHTYQYEEDGTW